LRQRNQELSQQLEKLEQAQRAAFRQAAPFRRGEQERVQQPKGRGAKQAIRAAIVPGPNRLITPLRRPYAAVRIAEALALWTCSWSSSSLKNCRRFVPWSRN
jgi:hypothetical protein